MANRLFKDPEAGWVPLAKALFSRWGRRDSAPDAASDEKLCLIVEDTGNCQFRIDRDDASLRLTPSIQPCGFDPVVKLYPDQITAQWIYPATGGNEQADQWAAAIGLVMNTMVNQFYDAIDARQVVIYAWVGSPAAPRFETIPLDIFRRAKITNWGTKITGGDAALCDGTMLHAIHVSAAETGRSHAGRKPKADPEQIRLIVFAVLDDRGRPATWDPDWRSQADVEKAVKIRIRKELRAELGESTVRDYTRRFMIEWLATKARN